MSGLFIDSVRKQRMHGNNVKSLSVNVNTEHRLIAAQAGMISAFLQHPHPVPLVYSEGSLLHWLQYLDVTHRLSAVRKTCAVP